MDKNNRGSPKLTVKQEKFVQCLIEGKSQRQAYIEAGYSTKNKKPEYIDTRACELFKTSKVVGRYNEIMGEHKEKALITRSDLISGLVKGFNMALGVEEVEIANISFGKLTQLQAKNTDLKALSKIADTIARLEEFYPKEDKSDINVAPVINISGVKDD